MTTSPGDPPHDEPLRVRAARFSWRRGEALGKLFGPDPHSVPAFVHEYQGGIGVWDAETFVERTVALLRDPQWDVDSVASVARLYRIAYFADEALFLRPLFRRLIEVIDTPSAPRVKLHAVRAMGLLGSPMATDPVPVLTRLIRDSHQQADLREAAISALPVFGPDAATASVPALVRTLEDGTVGIRLAACSTLRRLGIESRPAVRPLVAAVLKDADGAVRREAALALIQIDPEGRIVKKELRGRPARERFVEQLIAIGEEARPLRHRLIGLIDEECPADNADRPADNEDGPTDNSADKSKKEQRIRLPESSKVIALINRINLEKANGSGKKKREIALELTEGREKNADNLLRQVRRFKSLLE